MNLRVQTVLVVTSLITFYFVIRRIQKQRMEIKYAIIWITLSVMVIILGIFPQLVDIGAKLIGIATPTSALFMGMIYVTYILSFMAFGYISQLNQKVKDLTYEVAILKKELEDKKE